MLFRSGSGSELYRGLGSVVLGGLLVSTIFTLFLVPTLFNLVMQSQMALASFHSKVFSSTEETEDTPETEPIPQPPGSAEPIPAPQ